MRADGSHRALMSLVAELAQLGDGDVQAILADLDAASRERLDDLLDAYRRGDTVVAAASRVRGSLTLSPWLTDRLALNDDARSTGMSLHASGALRRIAASHGWRPPGSAGHATRDARPLLARMGLRP